MNLFLLGGALVGGRLAEHLLSVKAMKSLISFALLFSCLCFADEPVALKQFAAGLSEDSIVVFYDAEFDVNKTAIVGTSTGFAEARYELCRVGKPCESLGRPLADSDLQTIQDSLFIDQKARLNTQLQYSGLGAVTVVAGCVILKACRFGWALPGQLAAGFIRGTVIAAVASGIAYDASIGFRNGELQGDKVTELNAMLASAGMDINATTIQVPDIIETVRLLVAIERQRDKILQKP